MDPVEADAAKTRRKPRRRREDDDDERDTRQARAPRGDGDDDDKEAGMIRGRGNKSAGTEKMAAEAAGTVKTEGTRTVTQNLTLVLSLSPNP